VEGSETDVGGQRGAKGDGPHHAVKWRTDNPGRTLLQEWLAEKGKQLLLHKLIGKGDACRSLCGHLISP
jgi:hypothetical protein